MAEETTFLVKNCALISIATGRKAGTLNELRHNLQVVPSDCIYHHFWGGLLVPRFEEREFNNDFAGWMRHSLMDPILAERTAAIDPAATRNLEELRQDLLDLIEERLSESETVGWLRANRQFEFLRSQLVVFDSAQRLREPADLAELVPQMSTSTIFYHFIDARRRLEQCCDDFTYWLMGYEDQYLDLCEQLAAIDPFFSSLSQVRADLAILFNDYFGGGSE